MRQLEQVAILNTLQRRVRFETDSTLSSVLELQKSSREPTIAAAMVFERPAD